MVTGASTPTHVGQTCAIARQAPGHGLYPHARGANQGATVYPITTGPLPPRTWGKQDGAVAAPPGAPSTPTHVGQTRRASERRFPPRLYPHARGANTMPIGFASRAAPLPPRTWGKRTLVLVVDRMRASTPTHVGQTSPSPSPSPPSGLYPHARGANDGRRLLPGRSIPLPPRTWGKQDHRHGGHRHVASTPTHVGQTLVEPQNSAGAYSPITRFSFTVSPPASSGTRHTPSKTTGPATTSSKTTVR